MKRVLILTYYWPPSGGSGVQRWLKCVRYLREFGWEPVVYTASNGEYPVVDPQLEKEVPEGVEVIRRPIWEPYQLYKRFTGQKKDQRVVSGFLKDKKPSLAGRISMWIRGNLFIPDARCFWIRPSARHLGRWLRDNPVDAVVSTGPPHTMHLIAQRLSRRHKLPWVADFRDPWTNIDFYHELMLSKWADRRHHRLEKAVVQQASRVVVVGNTMREEFEAIGGRKVDVITNGYDEADLVQVPREERDGQFSIVHVGMLNQHRNHEAFWAALAELCDSVPGFRAQLLVRLVGKVDVAARNAIERHGLQAQVEITDYLEHRKAVAMQARAQLLLLSINDTPNARGVITGKLFEYIASGRPVLCIGPLDGDAAAIIRDARAGTTAGFRDQAAIRDAIAGYHQQYLAGTLETDSQGVDQYSRRALTGKFAQIFDQITP